MGDTIECSNQNFDSNFCVTQATHQRQSLVAAERPMQFERVANDPIVTGYRKFQ